MYTAENGTINHSVVWIDDYRKALTKQLNIHKESLKRETIQIKSLILKAERTKKHHRKEEKGASSRIHSREVSENQ